ncbi:MAG: group III truncated hemoglobin [Chitinophagales bacterium]
MKQDIQTRADIDLLVKTFYDKLLQDDLLKPIFIKMVLPNLDEHLTTIANFWDSILLDANNYRGNVTEKHFEVDKQFPLRSQEFEKWLFYWSQTIDELFTGDKAEHAKFRAKSIADIMAFKLDYINKNE